MLNFSKRRGREVVAAIELAFLALVISVPLVVPMLPTARAASTFTVDMTSSYTFSPQFMTISVGDSVQWHNTAGFPHTTTANSSDPAVWDYTVASGATSPVVTFNTAGTYNYICSIHFGFNMWGRITVTGSGVPEFSSSLFAVVGMLGIVVGLMFLRRKN